MERVLKEVHRSYSFVCLFLNGSFLAQVTGSVETLGLYEEQEILEENVDGKAEEGEEDEVAGVRVGEGESEGKALLEEPHKISLTVTQDKTFLNIHQLNQ